MGLVYLLVPLLWVSGLAATGEPHRLLLAGLLGLAGAQVLGAVYRHRLGPADALPLGRVALGAGAWFLVGAVAGLATAPLAVAGGSAVIAGATWVWGSERRPANALERRFEAETLRRVTPVLALYLLLQVSWPPWSALGILARQPRLRPCLGGHRHARDPPDPGAPRGVHRAGLRRGGGTRPSGGTLPVLARRAGRNGRGRWRWDSRCSPPCTRVPAGACCGPRWRRRRRSTGAGSTTCSGPTSAGCWRAAAQSPRNRT
jgi:hypothetical protein